MEHLTSGKELLFLFFVSIKQEIGPNYLERIMSTTPALREGFSKLRVSNTMVAESFVHHRARIFKDGF